MELRRQIQEFTVFGLHWPELIALLAVALIIFGPKRLPEIGSSLGKGIKEFKRSTSEVEDTVKESVQIPPSRPGDVHVPERAADVAQTPPSSPEAR
jgi:sec-independent protein translocase protein TatA